MSNPCPVWFALLFFFPFHIPDCIYFIQPSEIPLLGPPPIRFLSSRPILISWHLSFLFLNCTAGQLLSCLPLQVFFRRPPLVTDSSRATVFSPSWALLLSFWPFTSFFPFSRTIALGHVNFFSSEMRSFYSFNGFRPSFTKFEELPTSPSVCFVLFAWELLLPFLLVIGNLLFLFL